MATFITWLIIIYLGIFGSLALCRWLAGREDA